MYLLGLGLALIAMKYLEFGPVAVWSWWLVMLPFVLAVLWWAWADSSGYTKRKAMEAEAKRLELRRSRTKEALDANFQNKKR